MEKCPNCGAVLRKVADERYTLSTDIYFNQHRYVSFVCDDCGKFYTLSGLRGGNTVHVSKESDQ